MNKNDAGLLGRLDDLRQEAETVAGLVKKGGDALPELLRARLLIDTDEMAARLTRHRFALEALPHVSAL